MKIRNSIDALLIDVRWVRNFSGILVGGLVMTSISALAAAPELPVVDVNVVGSEVPLQVDTTTPLNVAIDTSSPLDVNLTNETVPVQVYDEGDLDSTGELTNSSFGCFFDVPTGKILQIEKISGFINVGVDPTIQYLEIRNTESTDFLRFTRLIPKQVQTSSGFATYEAENGGYASDTNGRFDGAENRDLEVRVVLAATQTVTGTCNIDGRLFDGPAP